MGSTNVSYPEANPAQVGRETLQAQLDLAPAQYAMEATYRPQYAALDMNILNRTLFGGLPSSAPGQLPDRVPGATGGNFEIVDPPMEPGEDGGYVPGSTGGGGALSATSPTGTQTGAAPLSTGPMVPTTTGTLPDVADDSLLGMMNRSTPYLNALQTASNTDSRSADVADVYNLGPQMNEAMQRANPELNEMMGALRDRSMTAGEPSNLEKQIMQAASNDLALGGQMNEAQQRQVAEQTRQAWGSRGLGRSQGAAVDEALQALDYGRGLEAERVTRAQQAAAMGLAREHTGDAMLGNTTQLHASTMMDPTMAVLGRPSSALGLSSGMTGQGMFTQQSGPQMFNPFSSDIMSMYAGNATNQMNSQIAGANNRSQMVGTGIGAVGAVVAAAI